VDGPAGGAAADGSVYRRSARASDLLDVALHLKRPLVAIGAPVDTYFPEVARSLHCELVVPQHAEVANAVGAVVGSIMQTVRVLITPQEGGEVFRVHCEDGVHDFTDLEEAAIFALQAAKDRAAELARSAGAVAATVSAERRDQNAMAAGEQFFVQSLITATATGRPHLAHDQSTG
jgi:N-methylhydantoinase A/oxoprolinase/acetone carboxylase beta subunit